MIPGMRRSITHDSIRKTIHLLLAFALTMPLLFQGGSMASASVGGFTFVDGNLATGVNVNPARAANDPAIVAFNNEIYAAWQETNDVGGKVVNQIHARKYNGSIWTNISGPNGINIDPSKMAGHPTLAVFNGSVYAAWLELSTYENKGTDKIRISRYTNLGVSWEDVTGNVNGLNVDPAEWAFAPSLAVFGDALYASWSENGKIRIKKYDGYNWTSAEEEGAAGLNTIGAATNPSMAASNDALYVMWAESSSDPGALNLRGKKYDGESWTSLDNGVPGGLNINPLKKAVEPSLAIYDGKLYVAWEENYDYLDYQIRVKRYDDPGWTSVDGGGPYGLNRDVGLRAAEVELVVFNNLLYAVWHEVKASTVVQHIRVKKYDGTKWTSADGDGPNGLNKNPVVAAQFPDVAVLNNQLFVAWQEKNGTTNQIRVAKQLPPAIISVTLSATSVGIFQGKYDQLSATVLTEGGAANTVTWTSSDVNNKVQVDQTGKITAAVDATPGQYEVRATSTVDSSKFATATVRVVAPSINSVIVNPSVTSVVQGGEIQLSTFISENGGAPKTVTWTSNDVNNKVTVDSIGKVVVAGDAAPGPYTITATSTYDNSKKGTSKITVTAVPPAINSVTVSPLTASVEQGGSEQFTATVAAVGGAAKTVEWTSNDSKVAVSSTGEVTVTEDAVPGQYTITATSTVDSSKYGTAAITVTAVPPRVNGVTVTPASVNLVRGGVKQLEVQVNAVGGADKAVTWSTSDEDVAVDGTGKVTVAAGAELGNYTITATSNFDSTKTGTATITVVEAPAITSVTVSPSAENVVQGNHVQLGVTVVAVGGADETVTWTSSDPAKVAVDNTGKVTVAADATPKDYTITAASNFDGSKTGTAVITVTQAPEIRSVIVSPSTETVMQGTSKQLTVAVDAAGGADETVTWTSSDPAKVAVDNTGKVTVAADATPKNYTITATSNFDGSKTGEAVITVTEAPVYSIAAIGNQTLTALTQGYVSGTQDSKSITILNTGNVGLNNLSVMVSGTNANDFMMTQLDSNSLTSGASTSFDIHARDGLPAGTYTATVTVAADQMTPVTFTVTQSVNLPNAPANPQNLVADGADRQVNLNWNTVTGATYYNLYIATASGQYNESEAVTVTSATYSVQNLINGTTYYFTVKAGNAGGLSAMSNEASATPAKVPQAPTNVTAVAEDGRATVTFTPPTDDGGNPITGYEVTAAPGNVVVYGSSSPIVVTGLSNGTSYTFTVKAITAAGKSSSSVESNSVVPRSSSSGESGTSSPPASATPETTNKGVDILVNGKVENAGTAATSKRNNQSVTTILVDQKKLEDKLAAEGQGAVVTIPVNTKSDVVIGELNGQMVKSMENKQAIVAIKTNEATYTIPAQQIQIGDIADKLGKSIALQDIKVQIEIAAPTADTSKIVENAAVKGTFTIMVPPLDFTIRAIYGNTSVEVSKFNAYVERTIAIPAGVDPNKITTGVVVDPDGTVRHVPTKITVIDGQYYAQINSLTNSTYSVVWHPLEFLDVANHWAKAAVNDMGSRMVIDGTGGNLFSPDRDITRAEFAAIVVRGLGLKLEKGPTAFSDVTTSDWFSSAINTAYAYQLIGGFEDGTFRPNDKLTREQAMTILARAMTITGLKAKLSAQAEEATLRPFEDSSNVSAWALSSVADSVQAGLVSGRSADKLAPKAHITRAEVATIIQRLLQTSDLI